MRKVVVAMIASLSLAGVAIAKDHNQGHKAEAKVDCEIGGKVEKAKWTKAECEKAKGKVVEAKKADAGATTQEGHGG